MSCNRIADIEQMAHWYLLTVLSSQFDLLTRSL